MKTQPPFTIEEPINSQRVEPLLPAERMQPVDRQKREEEEKQKRKREKDRGSDALPNPPDLSGNLGTKFDQRG